MPLSTPAAPRSRLLSLVLMAVGFVGIVVAMRFLARPNGWAALDARVYHLPVINHFIAHGGYAPDYPPGLSMFAGMHLVFARICLWLGIGPLNFDSVSAFGVQSLFGLAYVGMLVACVRVLTQEANAQRLLFFIVASSSYLLASWMWPTSDVLSFTLYLAFVLLCALPLSSPVIGAAIVLAALAPLVRQNYAVLASAFAFRVVMEAILARRWPALPSLALALLPLLAGAGALGYLYSLWGGLVPPDRGAIEAGFSPATPFHALALAGVLCWPFARLPFGEEARENQLLPLLLVCLALGAGIGLVLPFEDNLAPGRDGSYVWLALQRLPAGKIAHLAFGLMAGGGLYLFAGLLRHALRLRRMPAEIAVFAPLFVAMTLQRIAFQRYVEIPLFIAIAGPSLRELRWPRWRLTVIALWFALLFALGLAKELGLTQRHTFEAPAQGASIGRIQPA